MMFSGATRARWYWLLLLPLAACAAAALLVLYRVDPSQSSRYPKCAFHWLTGFHCPGCGTTRALHALLHGRLLEALHFNALLVVGVPSAALFAFWRHRYRFGAVTTAVFAAALGLAVVVFGVARNIPYYPFDLLAPRSASSSPAEANPGQDGATQSIRTRGHVDRQDSVGTAR